MASKAHADAYRFPAEEARASMDVAVEPGPKANPAIVCKSVAAENEPGPEAQTQLESHVVQLSEGAEVSESFAQEDELKVTHKLLVGSLPDDITEDELKYVFGTYGDVLYAHVMYANFSTGLREAFVFYNNLMLVCETLKCLRPETGASS